MIDRSRRVVATRNWVAANLWSTDGRPRKSVSLLWDPPGDGVAISADERQRHADGIRRRRIANIALRLGRVGLLGASRRSGDMLLHVTAKPEDDGMPRWVSRDHEDELLRPVDRPAVEPHSDTYAAALITAFGIRPIVSPEDMSVIKSVRRSGEPAMLFGLSANALHADEGSRQPWVSGQGIAAPDGISLFDLHRVDVEY